MKDFPKLITSVLFCELIGVAGTPFTMAAIPTWYGTLTKPSFSPPNWLFGPVWTVLYFLMGISLYLIWKQGWKNKKIKKAIMFFLAQLTLNFLWSILFFGLRLPWLGMVDIVALWLLIAITIKKFYPLSKLASYLLIPYLVWVSFAAILNFAIVILN